MNRTTLAFLGLATLPTALLGCTGGTQRPLPTPTPAATPVPTPPPSVASRIVFVSDKGTADGNKELFSVELAAGAAPTPGMLAGAVPRTKDTPPKLYVDYAPSLSSPGFGMVAFQSERLTPGRTAICLLELATGAIRLGTEPAEGQQDTAPAYSPVSGRIAFTRTSGGNTDIYVLDTKKGLSASNPQRITDDPGVDKQPSWSPDGSKLVFASNRSGNYDIYTASPLGLNRGVSGPLTTSPGDDEAPKFSPGGARILYQGMPGVRWVVFSMPSTGGEALAHTDGTHDDERACYSPDGKHVLYHSKIGLTRSLLSKPASAPASAEATVLSTDALGNDTQPSWGAS